MATSPEAFVERLAAISEQDGIPYRRIQLLLEEELKFECAVLEYRGHFALSHAFKCLLIETVERLNIECRPKIINPLPASNVFLPLRLNHNFQSLCAAERVMIHGYPYQGYTLLRNIFDSVVLTSAVFQGITDFYSVEGISDGQDSFDFDLMRKRRKITERSVVERMYGKHSGLSSTTIEKLTKLDKMFDCETHGGLLSMTAAKDWIDKAGPMRVLPSFEESAFSMFINRFCEVGWMTHRLLPLLQPPGVPLADTWRDKWRVIDESFELMAESLTRECGKKIGAAIIEFVNAKFPYNERCEFPL